MKLEPMEVQVVMVRAGDISIGEALRQLRHSLDLSMGDLSRRTMMPVHVISAIERSREQPSPVQLAAYLRCLVDPVELEPK